MTGAEAIAYIHSTSWLGSRPGLSRTIELLNRIGNPQELLSFVHVVGTNGKGSTCAFMESILRQAGYKTGLYTSPYLTHFGERMQVNGVPISDEALGEITAMIQPFAQTMADPPTEFELVTAIALLYFVRSGCDIVVLEAGLGGRLDSTNVIPSPELVVATAMDLDHTQYLGDTVEAIATEKAAVLKEGCSAVLYQQCPSVESIFQFSCQEKDIPLTIPDFSQIVPLSFGAEGQTFHYESFENLHISLLGDHQRHNAVVALEGILTLRSRGWNIPRDAIYQGLAQAKWPGRFEILSTKPLIIVDGGHNPQGTAGTVATLQQYFPGKPIYYVFGVLEDKDYTAILDILAPSATQFIAVTPNSPRAMEATKLSALIQGQYGIPSQPAPSITEGMSMAKDLVPEDGVVCALGSLYLVGEVRELF